MEIVWSQSALRRVSEIGTFIARDSPKRAEAFIDRLILSIDRLSSFPYSGAMAPENPAFRQVVFERYRIIYRITSTGVQIVTVISPGLSG